MSRRIELIRPGVVPYGQALTMQLAMRQALHDSQATEHLGYLVGLQHPPVVTLGKRGRPEDILARAWLTEQGAGVFRIDRGGEATFHAPGQLVLYPILDLERLGMGVVDLIRGMAGALGDVLRSYGVEASYDPDHPGVWTQQTPRRKIASVGMRVSQGVTTHGAAINLLNDMTGFTKIVPCGMPEAPMARLIDLLDEPERSELTVSSFLDQTLFELAQLLDVELVPASWELPGPADWATPLELP